MSCRHLAAAMSLPNEGADLQQPSLPAKGQRDPVRSQCTWEHGSQQPQPSRPPPRAALPAQPRARWGSGGAAVGPC